MSELNREYLEKKYGKDRLNELDEIEVRNTSIDKIDSNAFVGLNKLQIICLGWNNIVVETLDAKLFIDLPTLKEFTFFGNKINRIDSSTFNGLTKLESLCLNTNEITQIDENAFQGLLNLRELHLCNNKLKRIDLNMFKGLAQLKILKLNNNEIEDIDARLFEDLSNLKVLTLDGNRLKVIDRKCFDPLKSIQVIQLFHNDFNVLSFFKSTTTEDLNRSYYSQSKLHENGFLSNWKRFLDQFPEKEKQEEINIERYQCEKERRESQKVKLDLPKDETILAKRRVRSTKSERQSGVTSKSLVTCKYCSKHFKALLGVKIHERRCKKAPIGVAEPTKE